MLLALSLSAATMIGCSPAAQPTPSPSSAAVAAPTTSGMTIPRTRTPEALDTPAPRPSRPPDPPPPTGVEYIPESYYRPIVAALVNELDAYYAGRRVDLLTIFTAQGIEAAVARDWRFREVREGRLRFEQMGRLVFWNERANEPAASPPRLVLDIVVDLADDARIIDVAASTVIDQLDGPQRTATRWELIYLAAERRWLIDSVGITDVETSFPREVVDSVPPCPWEPPDAEGGPLLEDPARPFCDGDGRGRRLSANRVAISFDYPCGVASSAVLTVGWPLGELHDPYQPYVYVRDADGYFKDHAWLAGSYEPSTRLPDDAIYTGITNGNIDFWVSDSTGEAAIFVKRGDVIERWPRTADQWGVIDCN